MSLLSRIRAVVDPRRPLTAPRPIRVVELPEPATEPQIAAEPVLAVVPDQPTRTGPSCWNCGCPGTSFCPDVCGPMEGAQLFGIKPVPPVVAATSTNHPGQVPAA